MANGTKTDDEQALESVATLIEEYDENGARLTDSQELIENVRGLLEAAGYLEGEEAAEDDDDEDEGDDE